jgi:hypothetical protein
MRAFLPGTRGLVILVLLLGLPGWARSGTLIRYVDTAGNDDADGLTPQTAWRSLERADQLAPAGSEIRVGAGVYVEDSGGLGYLAIDSPSAGRRFTATGEVTLRAASPGSCVLALADGVDCAVEAFTFDGEGGCSRLVQGDHLVAGFQDCRFMGAVDRALDLASAPDLIVSDCDFGAPEAPLAAVGIWLNDCAGARIVDSRFFVQGARAICVDRSNGVELSGNSFGSEGAPLDLASEWCVFVVNSDQVRIAGNELTLATGYGLGVPTGLVDITGVEVVENVLRCTTLTPQYGILVGSETPRSVVFAGAHVEANTLLLPIPQADTSKHDLFVGYTQAPEISGNTVIGGGYGLGIKGNTGADVHHNSVSHTWRWGIVDKAGWDCSFHDNVVETSKGCSARMCNDDSAGRIVQNSSWFGNEFRGGVPAYEITSPVTPLANGITSEANCFRLVQHCDPILKMGATESDLWATQEQWSWDLTSALIAAGEDPVPRAESLQVGGCQAVLNVECSELCTGWLAFGTTALDDTVRIVAAGMALAFMMSELSPGTDYQYSFGLIDSEGGTFLSTIAGFITESGSAVPPMAEAEPLQLGAIYPNPGNPRSLVAVELSEGANLDLALYGTSGRWLRTLHAGPCAAGSRQFVLDGRDSAGEPLASGVYLVRARAAGVTVSRSWVLLH